MKKIFSILFLLAIFGLSGFSQLDWSNSTYYPTPTTTTYPEGIWFGDFNNDTKIDIIVKHWPESTMTLLMNNGDGTFSTPSTITSNLYVNDIVLVDLNNDNLLDIATTNADGWGNPDLVSIHLGNGDGTFQPMASYTGYGQYKYSLAAGDVTGDSYKDIVVTSAGWDGFSVLVNNGDGTFYLGNNYNSTNECSPINLADFNGDSHLDVAVGNGGWGYGFEMDIFFGNGDGTFNSFISYPTAEHPQIMVSDLDNQNGIDVIVDIPAIHASYYFKNDGAGAFTQVLIKENYDVKGLCDWNNDNKIDIVAFGWDTINNVNSGTYVILNNGNDIFSEPLLIDSLFTGYLSKLNNDNLFDFAYINVAQQAVGVKLQNETGNTLDSGLVAHYPFNGNANDESGNGNDGTVMGSVTLTTDRLGNANSAYNFPGTAFNYIQVADDLSLHLSEFTISAWIYSETDYGSGQIVQKNRDITSGHYGLYTTSVGATVSYGVGVGTSPTVDPAIGTWHMVTGSVSGNVAKFYIDGQLVADTVASSNFTYSGSEPLAIGMHYYSGVPDFWTYPFKGKIDDIFIYNRALSDYEVSLLYGDSPCTGVQTTVNLTICNGDSVLLGGAYQNIAGTYYDTLQTSLGCDSIIISNLTLNPLYVVNETLQITVCETAFLQGENQNTTGTYYDTLYTTLGCDSIIATYLEVINPYPYTDTVQVYDTLITLVYDTTYVTVYDSISVTDTLIIDVTISGITPPNNENTILIYPNPTNDVIYILTGDNYQYMTDYTIKIINTLGQTVFENLINSQLFTISVNTFGATGLYYVQIIDNNSQIIDIRKIVLE